MEPVMFQSNGKTILETLMEGDKLPIVDKGQKRNARPKPSGAAQLKRISKKRKNSK